MPYIEILRLDHRTFRDQRITTHVALASRTLGATAFTYSGEKDKNMEDSISDVAKRWGGQFVVNYIESIGAYIRNFNGIKVHLTMYGEPHFQTIETLKSIPQENLLLILGGAKVPRYVYEIVDFNTAVGHQPHSEVAAVALFLYDYIDRNLLYENRDGAKISIKENSNKSKRSDRFKDI